MNKALVVGSSEQFEQRVGGEQVHGLGRIDDHRRDASPVAAGGQRLLEAADLFDHDLSAGRLATFGLFGRRVAAVFLIGFGITRMRSGWLPDRRHRQSSQTPQACPSTPFWAQSSRAARASAKTRLPPPAGLAKSSAWACARRCRARAATGRPAIQRSLETRLADDGLDLQPDLVRRLAGVDHGPASGSAAARRRYAKRTRSKKSVFSRSKRSGATPVPAETSRRDSRIEVEDQREIRLKVGMNPCSSAAKRASSARARPPDRRRWRR